jgi:hypothetical protein
MGNGKAQSIPQVQTDGRFDRALLGRPGREAGVTRTSQDIEPNVEYAKALGNDERYFREGVKKNFAHAGHIPAEVCVELLKIGVNVYRTETSLAQIRAGLRKLGKEGFIWGS